MPPRKLSSSRNRTPRLPSIDEETIEETRKETSEEKEARRAIAERQELEERNNFWRELKEEAAKLAKELDAIEEKERQEKEERDKFWRELKEEAAALARADNAREEKARQEKEKARNKTGLAGYKRKSKRHKSKHHKKLITDVIDAITNQLVAAAANTKILVCKIELLNHSS